jgi:hypothetical protein
VAERTWSNILFVATIVGRWMNSGLVETNPFYHAAASLSLPKSRSIVYRIACLLELALVEVGHACRAGKVFLQHSKITFGGSMLREILLGRQDVRSFDPARQAGPTLLILLGKQDLL